MIDGGGTGIRPTASAPISNPDMTAMKVANAARRKWNPADKDAVVASIPNAIDDTSPSLPSDAAAKLSNRDNATAAAPKTTSRRR